MKEKPISFKYQNHGEKNLNEEINTTKKKVSRKGSAFHHGWKWHLTQVEQNYPYI